MRCLILFIGNCVKVRARGARNFVAHYHLSVAQDRKFEHSAARWLSRQQQLTCKEARWGGHPQAFRESRRSVALGSTTFDIGLIPYTSAGK